MSSGWTRFTWESVMMSQASTDSDSEQFSLHQGRPADPRDRHFATTSGPDPPRRRSAQVCGYGEMHCVRLQLTPVEVAPNYRLIVATARPSSTQGALPSALRKCWRRAE